MDVTLAYGRASSLIQWVVGFPQPRVNNDALSDLIDRDLEKWRIHVASNATPTGRALAEELPTNNETLDNKKKQKKKTIKTEI